MKRKKRKLIVQHKMIFDSVKHKQRAKLCIISFSYLHFLFVFCCRIPYTIEIEKDTS